MKFYKKPDSPFWWVDIRVDGKRHRESTKQVSKQKARTIGENIERELLAGNDPHSSRIKPPTLREYASRFLHTIDNGRLAEKSKQYYNSGWLLLRDQPIADLRIDRLTTGIIDCVNIPHSGSNVNCALRTLRRMLSLAVEENVIQRRPRIKMVEERQRERLVTADEEGIILATSPRTLRDAYLLVFDAGMRPGEAAGLAWQEVDFVRGVILVVRGKTGRKSRRHLPMTQRVRDMLVRRAKLTDGKVWVFPSNCRRRAGKPIATHSLSSRFAALKRAKGWPKDLVLYSARHTFATDLMGATGNLAQVQKTLGHTSSTTTGRYLHPSVADLGDIMDRRNESRNGDRHVFGHVDNLVQ